MDGRDATLGVMALHERWRAILHDLRTRGRYRRLAPPGGIDFSSNDYLGYGKQAFTAAAATPATSALSRSGAASRLLRGHHDLWDEVETALAAWHGVEAALVFTSGYVANEGLLSTIIGPDDFAASDQANHASIIDGLRLAKAERLVYRHNDRNHLEEGLRTARASERMRREAFIVTESLFGMDGDVAPLREIAALGQRYGAHLIVDEAHATGCFGGSGGGLVDQLGLRSRVLATMHTGGKALGVPGAYVAGSRLLKEYLVNRCRHLIYTTALPPQVAAWWLDMIPRVERNEAGRAALHDNARRFREALKRRGVDAGGAHYIVPVLIGNDRRAVAAAERLQEHGYDIRAIRPPTVPEGAARLRVSIHADHDAGLLNDVAECLVSATV
jgi:8-amino-7-oxononanoate synthase